jgi:hypothetical protein
METALFSEPSGIGIDENGAIYVADTGNHVIRKIENGIVTTIAGAREEVLPGEDYNPGAYSDGTASNARFNLPGGLYYAEGTLFIADTGNHAVRVLRNGVVTTIAGNGRAGEAEGTQWLSMMNKPTAVVYHNGVLYIADSLNNKINSVNLDLR